MSKGAAIRFPTTQWTVVAQAGGSGSIGADALGALLGTYLAPLRAHLLRDRRLDSDQADDLLQGFVSDKILERDLMGAAVREKGRFRTFLLVALDRYVSNQLRNQRRQVRSPQGQVSLEDAPDAANPGPTVSGVFQAAWARQVLANATRRMQEECNASARPDIWGIFEARILVPTLDGTEPEPYERLIARFDLNSVDAASNLLMTAKRMFARSLRGVVGEYMGEKGQIDQEIAELRAILASGGA